MKSGCGHYDDRGKGVFIFVIVKWVDSFCIFEMDGINLVIGKCLGNSGDWEVVGFIIVIGKWVESFC